MRVPISLGRHCQAAHQITRLTGADRPSQFFDWLITPTDGLLSLLHGGFAGFLRDGNIRTHGEHEGHHRVVDTAFGVELLHDFPLEQSIAARIGPVREKYAFLARRFLALEGDEAAVFLRQMEVAQEGEARAIHGALVRRFSPAVQLIVVADEMAAQPWAAAGVMAVQVRQPEPYDWKGSDAEWDAAFRTIGIDVAEQQ